jgi:hypothetical protein
VRRESAAPRNGHENRGCETGSQGHRKVAVKGRSEKIYKENKPEGDDSGRYKEESKPEKGPKANS